jgi:biopolymer transport protein TolQ
MNLPVNSSLNVIDLIASSGIVAKIVLIILMLFSIISWAIIIDKLRTFRRLRKESQQFLRMLQMRNSMRDIMQAAKQYDNNPFAAVFREAYYVFAKKESPNPGLGDDGLREKRNREHTDVVRLFDSVAAREMLGLERNLIFLATTGSVSPFLGLFGTVWGIMTSFWAIGFSGTSDLTVVAPGIAEALIATAAGLAAAIPAVMGYNYFVNKLKRLSAELEIYYSNIIETFTRREVHEVL